MIKRILLNNQDFTFTENDLPILIHGIDKAGSSLFTISLISQFAEQGSKILFFSRYDMAKEEFREQVEDIDLNKVSIVKTGDEEDLLHTLEQTPDIHERVILLKNIDALRQDIFPAIKDYHKLIISGDIDRCSFGDELHTIPFKTVILFSPLDNSDKKLPESLQKYEGYMWGDKEGVIKIESMEQFKIILVTTADELKDAMSVRTRVFQEEQGIPQEADFDGKDDLALNFVIYDDKPIGTARIRFPDSPKIAKVERVAVLPEYRGKNVGKKIMEFVSTHLESLGIDQAYLDSQESAKGFYEKLGYRQEGDVFEEVGIPHVKMVKSFVSKRSDLNNMIAHIEDIIDHKAFEETDFTKGRDFEDVVKEI